MCRKISASVDGGRAEGLACADPGARTPIGASGNVIIINNSLTFTPYLCDPERLDDLPIEDDHHNEREDVEKDSLDDGVDEARGIAPERNTGSQVQ